MSRITPRLHRTRIASGAALGLLTCMSAACGDESQAEPTPPTLAATSGGLCPDAKAFEEYQSDWLLAKACDFTVGEVKDVALSKLTSLAKGVVTSAINSYLPGLGSFLFGSSGDPFAAQADRIISELKTAKNEINNNVTFQVDDAVRRLQEWDTSVTMASFSSLSERLQTWNRQPYQTKVVDAGAVEIAQLHADFTTVRRVFENYIVYVNPDSSAQQPYSAVRMLHHYILLLDLELQVAASRHYWKGLNSEFVKDPTRSEAQIVAAVNASSLPAITRGEIAASFKALFDGARQVAQTLGERQAFLENTRWGAPVPRVGVVINKDRRTAAVQEGEAYEAAGADPMGNTGWHDAGTVEVNWFGKLSRTFVGLSADRFCATKMFDPTEMQQWSNIVNVPEAQRPVYQYGYFQTTDPWLGLFYHGPRPFCAQLPSGITPFPQDNPAAAGGIPQKVWKDPNILEALDVLLAEHARHSREYANTVSTGYQPFRLALDKWWRNVREFDSTVSTYRPYTAMDAEHDRLLWDNTGSLVQVIGATPDISVGAIVDIFVASTDTPRPAPEQRSKYVGFALQYGANTLLDMMNQARTLDAEHSSLSGGYATYLHDLYIDKYAAAGTSVQDFYATQADVEWQARLDH